MLIWVNQRRLILLYQIGNITLCGFFSYQVYAIYKVTIFRVRLLISAQSYNFKETAPPKQTIKHNIWKSYQNIFGSTMTGRQLTAKGQSGVLQLKAESGMSNIYCNQARFLFLTSTNATSWQHHKYSYIHVSEPHDACLHREVIKPIMNTTKSLLS